MRNSRSLVFPWILTALVVSLVRASCPAATLAVAGDRPSPEFVAAAQAAGWTLQQGAPAAASALLIATPTYAAAVDRAAPLAGQMLAAGKTVFVALGASIEDPGALEPLLPVNLWSARRGNFARISCGMRTLEPSVIPASVLQGLVASRRFDLHLPYAPIESGEHRYRWRTMGKDILNTDWRALITTDQGDRLPLLVEGRVGPGRVYVFGAGLWDPELSAAPGYAGFVGKLLSLAAAPAAAGSCDLSKLRIDIDSYQPSGLSARVTNAGAASAQILVAYKVRDAMRQLLNSATVSVLIPAGATVDVPLREFSPQIGSVETARAGDRLPYRWLSVAAASPDRTSVTPVAEAIVDTAPAVSASIDGPDIRFMADKASWPDREIGPLISDSAPISVYAVPAGSPVELNVSVSNGLHNIAPLAQASDAASSDPVAAQGLNDLAYTHGSLRGTLPLVGTWATKSAGSAAVRLTWKRPVTIAGQTLVGQPAYRFWDRANPRNYTLAGDDAPIASVSDAAYVDAARRDSFAPRSVTSCTLTMTGLAPKPPCELGTASIAEWIVWGWPGTQPPPAVRGRLLVTQTDPATGISQTLSDKTVDLGAYAQTSLPVTIPARAQFGPLAVDAVFTPTSGSPVRAHYDLFFFDDHPAIAPNPNTVAGLLCEAGFSAMEPFGTGTQQGSNGWCGPENGIWAGTHDMMEIGSRNVDLAERMFTTSVRFSHYSTPWRDMPSGEYYWDTIAPQVVKLASSPSALKTGQANIMLSDRWNGVPVNAMFTWADTIAFDQYLRKTTGHGLKSRSRASINKEISENYGDVWQKWMMDRYANKLIDLQKTVAAAGGAKLTVTTHGSFPLVGGDLGVRIGQTHTAVGTDLFWDLHDEDLIGTLGLRYGLIAANPDFKSGAYNEWGWTSAALNNDHWYGYVGAAEPARRQWYSTYFEGRATSDGQFAPLTMYGFFSQGAPGPKTTAGDVQLYYRTMRLTTRVRPEEPAGIGMAVSWNEQVRRMGKQAGALGFGLYAADGYEQIDALAHDLYMRLQKNGVPLSFVASTATLEKWKGGQPLVAVDGLCYDADEVATLARLNASGAPIIAVGGAADASAAACALFGVTVADGQIAPAAGTVAVADDGRTIGYATHRAGRGPTLAVPAEAGDLGGDEAAAAARAVLDVCGQPITVSPGVAVTPFVNHGDLFVSLSDLGDVSRTVDVSLTPSLLNAALPAGPWRVVDLDRGIELASKTDGGGRLSFTLPMNASDGRMLMIVPGKAVNK